MATFTVTATTTAASARGIALLVRVLTGAAETGGASTTGYRATSGAPQGNLTPNFTNSLPVFTLGNFADSGTFTILSNNTAWDNAGDATNGWAYAHGYYSGTVTASSGITIGASAPSEIGEAWASYEIQPTGGSTPVLDGSSPALVTFGSSGTQTVTTASFTPPAGAVLVALVAGNGDGSGANETVSVTDTSGLSLTWTTRAGPLGVNNGVCVVATTTMPGGVTSGPLLYPVPRSHVAIVGGRSGWQGAQHSR